MAVSLKANEKLVIPPTAYNFLPPCFIFFINMYAVTLYKLNDEFSLYRVTSALGSIAI